MKTKRYVHDSDFLECIINQNLESDSFALNELKLESFVRRSMSQETGFEESFGDRIKKIALGPSLLFVGGNTVSAVVGYVLADSIGGSKYVAVGALLLAGLTIAMQVHFVNQQNQMQGACAREQNDILEAYAREQNEILEADARQQRDMMEAYARQIGGVNRVIFEPDLDVRVEPGDASCESGYVGACYEALAQYVEQATESIFVIPNPFREGEIASWESKQREQHLKRIEDVVAQKKGLHYMRIQQVPRDAVDPWAHFGALARDHIVRMGDRHGSRVSLRYLKSDETSGFMVVDGRLLVKYLTGVNSVGQRNLIALALQETPSSLEVRRFCEKLTLNMLKQSMPIPMPASSAQKPLTAA
jgi:hypothetical protein